MNTVLAVLMVALTILASLGLGLILGYALVSGILQAMRPRPEVKPAPSLAASQANSGD